jgi:K+-transporting ATPase ATPase A chain
MTIIGWIQILLYCAIVVALVKPLGWYMTRVFSGERTLLSFLLRPIEAGIYAAGGVDEKREQHWVTYTVAMLLFHVGGFLILYVLLRLQAMLPFNPAGQSAVAPDLSFTRRRASSPTPTGRTTAAKTPCPTWCRCSA